MSKKKKKNWKAKNGKLSAGQLQKDIIKLFKRHPKTRFSAKQIVNKMKIGNSKDSVLNALQKLEQDGSVFTYDDKKFRLDRREAAGSPKKSGGKKLEGIVDMTRSGAGYIVIDDMPDDVFVHARNMGSALNGDRVEVSLTAGRGKKPEGKVSKVLKRAADHFIGKIVLRGKYGIVVPNKMGFDQEIYIEPEHQMDADHGDMVVVQITKWATGKMKNPIGEVTKVLGAEGGNDMEMNSILVNNGFDLDFSPEVIAEMEALNTTISKTEVEKRRDMRKTKTFTIDPVDAKDFDDALSVEIMKDGNIEVGVHIADVTHFVKPGTKLDKEAYERSTSVYLVDRVLPMLPEKISNELCSLRPNEDKCTFSAVFTFDKNYKLIDKWFGKTLIHSDRRFAYEEAQEVLEKGEGDMLEEIQLLDKIAKKLRKAKFKNGAIAFEAEEVRFKLDENGKPIDLYVKERKDAHLLIEDFMLLANKECAKFIAKKGKSKEIPFVYRIHDLPNEERVESLALFAKELGVTLQVDTPKQIAASYNKLAKEAKTNDTIKMLEPLAIRTMAKAEYSPDNIGHYGLAFEYYSHFTSPIRRYSDVLTHRLLEKNLTQEFRTDKEVLAAKCKHISQQERKAMTAERESIKYKQVEFISQFIGEEFEGAINGMIDRGLFVELKKNKCEGMVGFDTLNEPFEIEDGRMKAVGKRTGRVLKMGDTVQVRVKDADLMNRRIELELVSDDI